MLNGYLPENWRENPEDIVKKRFYDSKHDYVINQTRLLQLSCEHSANLIPICTDEMWNVLARAGIPDEMINVIRYFQHSVKGFSPSRCTPHCRPLPAAPTGLLTTIAPPPN